jgi:hypothetical protein
MKLAYGKTFIKLSHRQIAALARCSFCFACSYPGALVVGRVPLVVLCSNSWRFVWPHCYARQ